MAHFPKDELQDPLTELGVDTEFWERSRLLDEFNELSAQGVHCRFWPGRESGRQLEGDWVSEVVNPELPEPLPGVLRAIESDELSSLDRFVAIPVYAGGVLSREGRSDMALRCYSTALENAPNPWIQSELGYLFLERAGTESLPACAAALDKAEVIGRVGEPVPFSDRSGMLDLALQAFGRAWAYTYTQVYLIECDPDLAFGLLTLDGLRVTLSEIGHQSALEAVCREFWEHDDLGMLSELDFWLVRDAKRSFRETYALLRQRAPDAPGPDLLRQCEEKCARQFGPYWDALTEHARLIVYQEEYGFSRPTAPTLRNWGGPMSQYCVALESILRQRLGAAIDAEGPPLTDWLRSLLGEQQGRWRGFAGLTVGQFSYLLFAVRENQLAAPLFRDFLEKNAPGQATFYLGDLAERLGDLSRKYRNPSVHPDEKVVSKTEVRRVRDMLLPNPGDNYDGLLAQLAVFGQPVSHTEQG